MSERTYKPMLSNLAAGMKATGLKSFIKINVVWVSKRNPGNKSNTIMDASSH